MTDTESIALAVAEYFYNKDNCSTWTMSNALGLLDKASAFGYANTPADRDYYRTRMKKTYEYLVDVLQKESNGKPIALGQAPVYTRPVGYTQRVLRTKCVYFRDGKFYWKRSGEDTTLMGRNSSKYNPAVLLEFGD